VTTAVHRLPVKARLTIAFAAGMVVLFLLLAVGLYSKMSVALLDEIDSGLRFRAEALEADASRGPSLAEPTAGLIEGNEAFAQLVTADGRVLAASPGLHTLVLSREELAQATRARFFQHPLPGIPGEARILALPLGDRSAGTVVIVGTSMSDRTDALHQLRIYLAIGGPLAILLASAGGWVVAGLALRPVERMRLEASAISASGVDHRLSVPLADDELRLLATTLNGMLDRLDTSIRAERRFLDNASHELRNPLTALKAELDLARSRPRPASELQAAVESASEETDRLVRLANDMLVLARATDGRLPVHRAETSLRELIESALRLFQARAAATGVRIHGSAPDWLVLVDGMRVRQAVDNLVDNAIRHTPAGGTVTVRADVTDDIVQIVVTDTGPGFPAGYVSNGGPPAAPSSAPSERPDVETRGNALGLAIVRAVAQGHDGTLVIHNPVDGGAQVSVSFRT
jgi:two-component system OmpR family sensor kinase